MNASKFRLIVDVIMTVVLTFLVSYQITSTAVHEWLGVVMTLLVIVHQYLNRRFYASLFSGRYSVRRIVTTIVFVLTLGAYFLTAFCGLAMSCYAAPFLYGVAPSMFVRPTHLAMSYWAFILTGIHLGLHIPAMFGQFKPGRFFKSLLFIAVTAIAGAGFYLFLKNGLVDYMLFKNAFAFFDYDKSFWFVLLENVLMLSFWTYSGAALIAAINAAGKKRIPFLPVLGIIAALLIGLTLNPGKSKINSGWDMPGSDETDSHTATENEAIPFFDVSDEEPDVDFSGLLEDADPAAEP